MPQTGIQGSQINETSLNLIGVDGSTIANVDAITLQGQVAGTGANNILALDSSSRILAVDGSLLLNVKNPLAFGGIDSRSFVYGDWPNGSHSTVGGGSAWDATYPSQYRSCMWDVVTPGDWIPTTGAGIVAYGITIADSNNTASVNNGGQLIINVNDFYFREILDNYPTNWKRLLNDSDTALTSDYVDGLAVAAVPAAISNMGGVVGTLYGPTSIIQFQNTNEQCYIYKLSKDFDGGAWRHKMAHTSWEKEVYVEGKYLGSLTDVEITALDYMDDGDVVWDNINNLWKKYIVDFNNWPSFSANGWQTTTRGNKRKFPVNVVVVSEEATIWLFNGDTGVLWMVFNSAVSAMVQSATTYWTAIKDGRLYRTGSLDSTTDGLTVIDFASDSSYQLLPTGKWTNGNTIGSRNNTNIVYYLEDSSFTIASYQVYYVSLTTITGASLNYVGLPEHVISLGTINGQQIINGPAGSGTSVYVAAGAYSDCYFVKLINTHSIYNTQYSWNNKPHIYVIGVPTIDGYTYTPGNGYLHGSELEMYDGGSSADVRMRGFGTSQAVFNAFENKIIAANINDAEFWIVYRNPAIPTSGMVQTISTIANTGPMVGNSKISCICETGYPLGPIDGSEIMTAGTFDVDVDETGFAVQYPSWTVGGSSQPSVVGGQLQHAVTASMASMWESHVLDPYTSYNLSFDVISGSGRLHAIAGGLYLTPNITITAAGSYNYTFVTAGSVSTIIRSRSYIVGTPFVLDNIQLNRSIWDYSENLQGLDVVGSSVRYAAFGETGSIQYLNGFSATSYLTQYNTGYFDHGAGDFCYSFIYSTSDTGIDPIFEHGNITGDYVAVSFDTGGVLTVSIKETTETIYSAGSNLADGTFRHYAIVRKSGFLFIYINGKLEVSTSCTLAPVLSTAVITVGIGELWAANWSTGSIAAFNISLIAPTADQLQECNRWAQSVIAGTPMVLPSNSVTIEDIKYDSDTNLINISTNTAFSQFTAFGSHVSDTASVVGSLQSGDSTGGINIQGGNTGVYISKNAVDIKEQLRDAPLVFADEQFAPTRSYFDDVVVNGDIATDTIWTKGTGWTIAAGVATKSAGTASTLSQSQYIPAGTRKMTMFDISGWSADTFTFNLGGTTGTARSADGPYTEILHMGSVDTNIAIDATTLSVGSVDNIRVLDVDPYDNPSYRIPNGYKPTRVWYDGVETTMDPRLNYNIATSTFDWVVIWDGYVYWATPTTLPVSTVNVQIEIEKENI